VSVELRVERAVDALRHLVELVANRGRIVGAWPQGDFPQKFEPITQDILDDSPLVDGRVSPAIAHLLDEHLSDRIELKHQLVVLGRCGG
jgi:hypothetical protein